MKQAVQWVITVLLILFLILTFYAIFNVGNPKSLFRFVIHNPSYDTTVTVVLAGFVALLAMILYAGRMQTHGPIKHLLEINREYIRELREEGKSEEYIAESFLEELGSEKGVIHALAKRRVLRHLSRL